MFSLVTACMNREPHLRRNLPLWLRIPQVDEIVIVDWSNQRPLGDLCALDSRIKVVRIEGEPQWILSYAYNAGIERATQPLILKCDADCIPAPEIVRNVPGPKHFFAGRWETGSPVGKPSVSGQCIFSKTQFEAVNGYSEIIRTYGRDDVDFYDRLVAHGYELREIVPALLDFIDHTQAERTSNQTAASENAQGMPAFFREPGFKEIRNYFLTQALPWSRQRPRASYTTVRVEEGFTVLERNRAAEIPIPAEIEARARLQALRHFAGKAAGLAPAAADKLDERACLAVISSRIRKAATAASPQLQACR